MSSYAGVSMIKNLSAALLMAAVGLSMSCSSKGNNNSSGGGGQGGAGATGTAQTGVTGTTGTAQTGVTGTTGTGVTGTTGTTGSTGTGMGMIGPAGAGYYISGDWHGYAWTATSGTGTTITPTDFGTNKANDPLCVSGSVAGLADYSGVAILGVNLNQLAGKNMMVNSVTPTTKGVLVNITNTGQTNLRLQIQGPNGATDASQRWCVPVTGAGGFYPWSSFTTECWSTTMPGTAYANDPITALMITVPGGNTTALPYNFCLNSFAPADSADGTVNSPCTAGAPAVTGMTSDQYGGHYVCGSDNQQYAVWNNRWGTTSSTQTISWNGASFSVDAQTSGGIGGVISYPSIFIGSINSFTTTGSNLPIQVSKIQSVNTSWTNNATTIGGNHNAAYDVWFNTSNVTDLNAPSGGYLMVWFHKPSQNPIGQATSHGVTIPGVTGSWDVWTGTNGGTGKPCISYVSTTDLSTLTFDLNKFIVDAQTNHSGYMQSSWFLVNVFAGFEIWDGGVGLKTTAFSAVVK